MARCAKRNLWTSVLGDRLVGSVWEGRGWFEPCLSDFLWVTVCIYSRYSRVGGTQSLDVVQGFLCS
jgi:hypothetical protein